MQVSVKTSSPSAISVDLLAIPVFEMDAKKRRLPRRVAALDKALGGCISDVVAQGDFRGSAGESQIVYPGAGCKAKRVLILGLGAEEKCSAETLRELAGRCVQRAAAKKARKLALVAPVTRKVPSDALCQAIAEGAVLGGYRFDRYQETKKNGRPNASLALLFEKLANATKARRAAARGVILAESQNIARDLSNEPANAMPPVGMARVAVRVGREAGLRTRVMEVPELRRRKMGGILAVGQGSANPPRLIVMDHNPPMKGSAAQRRKRPTICLIGKGITFDSGGISIKPSANMHEMKHDMSGAAAVVGAMRAVGLLKLPHRIVGIIAAAENMPGANAYRPSDIVRSHSGKTIEVLNTDAEGRIVLADALSYAVETYDPIAMIDLATLTGACVIALGRWATGLMGTDDDLIEEIRQAGERSGECAWPLPIFDGHKKAMRSSIADLQNVAGREAGTSTAGAFLSNFVGETPWVHLDIAGTGWTSKTGPTQPRGATGVGVRMLLEYLGKVSAG